MKRRKRIVRPGLLKKPRKRVVSDELLEAQATQLLLAEAYLDEGDPAAAELACRRVLGTTPLSQGRRAQAQLLLGRALAAQNKVEAARAALVAARSADSADSLAAEISRELAALAT